MKTAVKIRIFCPICETSSGAVTPGSGTWTCPSCEHVVALTGGSDEKVSCCAVCGGTELYRKKDFPHGLGMGILLGAFIASTITYWLYFKVLTWVILLGSAAFDGLLYLWVKDVIVCYRCHAEHRGAISDPERHPPFELTIHERYRQEQIRQEQIRQG